MAPWPAPLKPGAVDVDLKDVALESIASPCWGVKSLSTSADGVSMGDGSSWRSEMRVSSDAFARRDRDSMAKR